MTEVLDRIRGALVGLKMPRALEALDHTMQRLEQGEILGIEAIDALLSEEYATRETRRIEIALRTAKLMPIQTLEGFDFSFQPSLDRERITALAQLDFIPAAAPCSRDPNRGRELPSPRTRRSHPGARPRQRPHRTASAAEKARTPAQERS